MGDLPYELMNAKQAVDALDAYLAEREPALTRLRAALADDGEDPDEMLDRSVYSVSPLWVWISARIVDLSLDPRPLDEDPSRSSWPSWARHGMIVDPHPPAESLALVDGFVSYLGQVIAAAVPNTQWLVGKHRIGTYPMLNYPVLAADDHQIFLPALPLYSVYQSAHGREAMGGTEMLNHVRRTITALRGEGPVAESTEEPKVSVVADVDSFDVGLRPDLVANHPDLMERLIAELTDRDGVASIIRYGPDALVVEAPDWDETRVKLWLTLWLERALLR